MYQLIFRFDKVAVFIPEPPIIFVDFSHNYPVNTPAFILNGINYRLISTLGNQKVILIPILPPAMFVQILNFCGDNAAKGISACRKLPLCMEIAA